MKTWTLPLVLAGAMMLVALPEAASAQSGQAVINAPANVRRSGRRLPDCRPDRRGHARDGLRLSVRLLVVRHRPARRARLDLRGAAQLSVSGQPGARAQLRPDDRAAHRDVLDRRVLGQLLSWPAVVSRSALLATPASATAAAGALLSRCRTASARGPLSRRRAAPAGTGGRTGEPPARTRCGPGARAAPSGARRQPRAASTGRRR